MTDGPATVDVSSFLKHPESNDALEACKALAETLRKTSCLIIRDPRVSHEESMSFLDLMEDYFSQPSEAKMKDVRPQWSYQLGATPEFVEVPRDHSEKINSLVEENAAHTPKGADAKWRYFWRIGERPKETKHAELNEAPVIPQGFPQWTEVMNGWGQKLHDSVETVSQMLAVGLGLPRTALSDLCKKGPHLLAPTGSDLAKFGELGTIFAGFHYDLNFLTIHGKSRFPGLYIWTREGKKILVRVPDGCLLVQAGKQLEWLTGGEITAGFHEVVVSPETLQALEKQKERNRPLWRISSTLFFHIASDQKLRPLAHFETEESKKNYPEMEAGDQVMEELRLINLASPNK